MQSSAVVASTPGVPASGGQTTSVAGDGSAPVDVGFAALLAAQIQGDPVVALIPVASDVAVADLSSVDSKQQDLPPVVAVDPLLAGMMLAQVVPPPVEIKPQNAVLQTSAELALHPTVEAAPRIASLQTPAELSLRPPAELSLRPTTEPVSQLAALQTSAKMDVSDAAVLHGMERIPLEAKGEIAPRFAPLPVKSTAEGKAIVPSVRTEPGADLDLVEKLHVGMGQEKAEEFAVSGKVLPLHSGVDADGDDVRIVSTLTAENQHLPESVLVALPASMAANQTAAVAEMKAVSATVQPLIGNAGWGDAMGQKVVWMANQQQQVAELHLNPPHLGPMEVRLTVNNDQVTAIFVSHQPAVREAIEAAMPRLREMFADNGMMLGNAMVSSDSLPQQQASGQDGQASSSSRRLDYPIAEDGSTSASIRGILPLRSGGRGLVDLFA